MKELIFASLMSNAASLGVHWIYNHTYLEEISKSRSLLFMKQDQMFYDQAKPSFYVYPDHEVGQVTVQGEILRWLYEALKQNPKLSQSDYEALLYEKFRPGGAYHGYVETYAKKMVLKTMSKELDIMTDELPRQDTHLVGFMPYLATKALELPIQKAWELAQLFTDNQYYLTYYLYFDVLFELIREHALKDAIKLALPFAPEIYKEKLEKAMSIKDTNTFIKAYAGRACSIDQAIPVIMHILYHTENFTDALELNAKIGGASSDRGLLIGAILNDVCQIPESWIKKVNPYLSK
jgi:hypothetical protein